MFASTKVVISPSWQQLLRNHGFHSLDDVYRCTTGEIITHSHSTEVRRIALTDSGGVRTLFIKKYWVNSARQLWSGALRGTFFGRSKARREFANLARLRAWDLGAPSPVAFGEERRLRWLVRSFLISEGVPDPVPLDLLIRDALPAMPETAARLFRRELIERLADCVRRLHERRFVHQDLFWRNIILSAGALDQFYLIDAHKGRRWRLGEEKLARAKDLATLDAPADRFFRRTERLRFLLRYRGHARLTNDDRELIQLCLQRAAPLRQPQVERVIQARSLRT